jgi:enterochelin esterase family protein
MSERPMRWSPRLALAGLVGCALLAPPAAWPQATSFDSLLEGSWRRSPVSPRIEELIRSARGGDRDAVTRFWTALSAGGAPLIEPDGADTLSALVTFVWRSAGPVHVGAILDFSQSALRMLLQRAPGTDVWFRTYRVPADARFLYAFAVDDESFPFEFGDSTAWPAAPRVDPLNQKSWGSPPQLSLVELPRAPAMPWRVPDSSRARGAVGRFGTPVRSEILGNERTGFVYRPAGYADSLGPYPLLVFGASYISQTRLPAVLDYLIAAGRIPPVVAAFFDWPPGRQDLESGCIPEFGDFLASEFLPWVRARVRITTDPARVIIGGASAGGFSAACVALRHPEAFGNVLSESGAFWRGLGNTAAYWSDSRRDDAERVWFSREVAATPRVAVRYYLTVGTLERSGAFGEGAIAMVHVNRQVRDVLRAKGYDVTYREISGGHDPYNWETALPAALETLLGAPGRTAR